MGETHPSSEDILFTAEPTGDIAQKEGVSFEEDEENRERIFQAVLQNKKFTEEAKQQTLQYLKSEAEYRKDTHKKLVPVPWERPREDLHFIQEQNNVFIIDAAHNDYWHVHFPTEREKERKQGATYGIYREKVAEDVKVSKAFERHSRTQHTV